MAKEWYFLMWLIIFATISTITTHQNVSFQNDIFEAKSICLEDCVCSPCHLSNSPGDLLVVKCNHTGLDKLKDMHYADKICSL